MAKTGIVILAAGASSRLGKPKQLLVWKGRTLIEHVVAEATAASLSPIIVVTGSEAERIAQVLTGTEAVIIRNETWQEGMAPGIVKGVLAAVSQHSELKSLILAVCDQPFVSAELFQALIQKKEESGKGIAACRYADTLGTPALFDAQYFTALTDLRGTEGARKLLKQYAADVVALPFPQGAIDIDTEEDYQYLVNTQ